MTLLITLSDLLHGVKISPSRLSSDGRHWTDDPQDRQSCLGQERSNAVVLEMRWPPFSYSGNVLECLAFARNVDPVTNSVGAIRHARFL